jgi:dienelactone hydrolase
MRAARVASVRIDLPEVGGLDADLATVAVGGPLVVFAHGSGSGRHSARNQAVAHRLQQAGFGTLLLDLLTVEEERVEQRGGRLRFDVERLADRLLAAVQWVDRDVQPQPRVIGYFGASTGAAAVLVAAARQGERIGAVVCRGGRPDLASQLLPLVAAPTLLIVGGRDEWVLEMNRRACAELRCATRLDVVPGASHLFQEPGALEQVADHAADWFTCHLSAARRPG